LDHHVRVKPGVASLFCALALAQTACPKPPGVVQHQTHGLQSGLLAKVAVAPFSPAPNFERSGPDGEIGSAAADLVARFVTEALRDERVSVIAPSDLVIAFEGSGLVLPRQDARALAALAASEFGATAVVLGVVSRYRNRSGEALGSSRPASVRFQLTLHQAPSGNPIWTARFDQTQPTVTENPLLARQYPGFGTRFLTAAELARWGAERVVSQLPAGLR
jgi:hypothetical protein